jgi:hypothetical protein
MNIILTKTKEEKKKKKKKKKNKEEAGHQRFTLGILAAQESEMRKIMV